MSTRSAFGTIVNGHFKGRYIHSDGYPSGVGHDLAVLIRRDGVERVLKKITEDRYGWSNLQPELPDPADPKIVRRIRYAKQALARRGETIPYALYSYLADRYGYQSGMPTLGNLEPGGMYGDGRFVAEPGYGTAYTTAKGFNGVRQSEPDQWVETDVDGVPVSDWGTEWLYGIDLDTQEFVIMDPGSEIWKGRDGTQYGGGRTRVLMRIPLSELTDDEDVWSRLNEQLQDAQSEEPVEV